MQKRNFQIYKQCWNPAGIAGMNTDLELLASYCKPEDVFRCEKGIKQIQNLHTLWDVCDDNLPQGLGGEWDDWIGEKLNCDVELMNMQYFIKYPDYKITSPHQDGAYFGNSNEHIYTCWIPLQDVGPENSCLWYVDQYLTEILPHSNVGTKVRTRTGATGYSQYTDHYSLDSFKPTVLKLGDMLVHDQFALHYANENSTEIPRVALTFIFKTYQKLF